MLLLVILLAIAFDYVNGFHDTANAIATSVATRALAPRYAILMATAFNFIGAFAGTAVAQEGPPPAFRGRHEPKPLPFDPAKLNGISEKLIRSHWENNYQGAVRALNVVETRLDAMMKDNDLPPYVYGDLKREESLRTAHVGSAA